MLAAHLDTLRGWSPRRWVVAAVSALATILVIGLPTVLIPNPVFGREVPTVWWNWPALLVAAVLSGLLVATYVRRGAVLGLATGSTPVATYQELIRRHREQGLSFSGRPSRVLLRWLPGMTLVLP